MATNIVKHDWNGNQIRQRLDNGYVNLTDMCRAGERRVSDYLELPSTKAYIDALAKDLSLIPENLVIKKRGAHAGTFAHPEIAIDCAQWINMSFRIWANRTLRQVIEQARFSQSRLLDIPKPGTAVFESWFEGEIERITGLHKNDIRNGKFYWEFVYAWLTEEEKSALNRMNPVLPSGRRRFKIHDCLTAETKSRLIPLQYKLAGKIESCNSVYELRRMIGRVEGIDQPNLFDGIWQTVGLLPGA